MLTLYPAIDIRDGRAVRLLQGDYDRETPYDADPVDAARRWVDGGAEIVHVVDLDGARAGAPANLSIVARIAAAVDVPVQFGGGLRDRAAVESAFAAGAARAVLGTSASATPTWLGGSPRPTGAGGRVGGLPLGQSRRRAGRRPRTWARPR